MSKNQDNKSKSKPKRRPKSKLKRRPKRQPTEYCLACGTELFIKDGYAQTKLCGPCCMGESGLIEEAGETW